tara:strand:+ start:552 stop:818 length:267 start_codon:yes stop_codon:yes gene_type:complete
MTNSLNNTLAEANNVPNGFLNAAQRTIIIDWIIETEEETSLMDELITREELAEMRQWLESMPNPKLRRQMVAYDDLELNRAVRKAANR